MSETSKARRQSKPVGIEVEPLLTPEEERVVAAVQDRLWQRLFSPEIKMYVYPGGEAPVQRSDFAAGFDFSARAIVTPDKKRHPNGARVELYDFSREPVDLFIRDSVVRATNSQTAKEEWAYLLKPGDQVVIGLGVAFAPPDHVYLPLFARSSFLFHSIVSVIGVTSIIDTDFRGEFVVAVRNNGQENFLIFHRAKFVQGVFSPVVRPRLNFVKEHYMLPRSKRGVGGLGSTDEQKVV